MPIINRSTLRSTYKPTPDKEITVNTLSNPKVIENLTESFEKKKYTEKEFATIGEEVIQEIEFNNNSNFLITDIMVMDYMSEGATFKAGSVEINGESFPNYNPRAGFPLPNPIDPSDPYVLVTYTIVIDENPPYDHIQNTAAITYTANDVEFVEDTNTVTIQIIDSRIEIEKTASTSVATVGSTITFTHNITNSGSFTHSKLMFTDPLPAGLTFVSKSVQIDGVAHPELDPTVGFALTDLPAKSTTTITFDVKVV